MNQKVNNTQFTDAELRQIMLWEVAALIEYKSTRKDRPVVSFRVIDPKKLYGQDAGNRAWFMRVVEKANQAYAKDAFAWLMAVVGVGLIDFSPSDLIIPVTGEEQSLGSPVFVNVSSRLNWVIAYHRDNKNETSRAVIEFLSQAGWVENIPEYDLSNNTDISSIAAWLPPPPYGEPQPYPRDSFDEYAHPVVKHSFGGRRNKGTPSGLLRSLVGRT